jgi:rubredoxin
MIDGELCEEIGEMKKYACDLCEWVYDPEKGFPEDGIKPGTPFEDLPEDFVCPDCGADKDDFSPVED